MNIIFSTHDTNKDVLSLILVWSKKNNIYYLAYVASSKNSIKKIETLRKNINFYFFSDNQSEINTINSEFTDIQYVDSDLDFA